MTIPNNLVILGTMNTADRSIALVDYALRRRFFFVEMLPDEKILSGWLERNSVLSPNEQENVVALFNRVNREITEDQTLGENFQVGHTYYFTETMEQLNISWKYAILPLIKEYLFGDVGKLTTFSTYWSEIMESVS